MTETGEPAPLLRTERATSTILNAIGARPRTILVAAALAIVAVGIAMNWSALVAAGIAPLIISALPCAVMCALGLCMSRTGTSSCASQTQSQQPAAPAAESLQVNSLAGRAGEPESHQALVGRTHPNTEPHEIEHQQPRRPINA
jgi:hypothetical protein